MFYAYPLPWLSTRRSEKNVWIKKIRWSPSYANFVLLCPGCFDGATEVIDGQCLYGCSPGSVPDSNGVPLQYPAFPHDTRVNGTCSHLVERSWWRHLCSMKPFQNGDEHERISILGFFAAGSCRGIKRLCTKLPPGKLPNDMSWTFPIMSLYTLIGWNST